jgi:hypothetical protein
VTKRTGTVVALTAGLDPAEKEQVWNIGEDNKPEDVSEYTDILEGFRDVFAWNMCYDCAWLSLTALSTVAYDLWL